MQMKTFAHDFLFSGQLPSSAWCPACKASDLTRSMMNIPLEGTLLLMLKLLMGLEQVKRTGFAVKFCH